MTSPLQIVQCGGSCGTLHDREILRPDTNTTVRVSNEGIKVGYMVEERDGVQLGCVYMEYDHVTYTPIVLISSMTRCE